MKNIEIFSFEYNLSKENYLNYFLYNANHSKTVISARRKNKIILFIIYFLLLFFVYYSFEDKMIFIINLIIFIVFFSIFLFFDKNRYIRHYKKYIDEKLSERTGKNFFAEFQYEKIIGKEGNSESSISYKDFNEVIEIDNYIFVKVFSTETLIFPKNIKIFENIKSNLKIISKNYNIPYKEELEWKFK